MMSMSYLKKRAQESDIFGLVAIKQTWLKLVYHLNNL